MFENAKSWPFQEARSLLAHIAKKGKKPGDVVTFETGYGPSGAPHIGTFAEVVRTLWVMKAFDTLTDGAYKVRLIMFSDDYDAMRKVPDDMPEWLNEHLGEPLSRVPNPYPTMGRAAVFADQDATSFGGANNDLLVQFVDEILKSYDKSQVGHSPDRSRVSFVSATNYYRTGKFNDMLSRIWDNFDKIQAIMLPTLGEERRETYSPFMPMSFEGGRLLQVKTVPSPALPYFVEYEDVAPDGPRGFSCRIHDGHVKLQWKVDWAMRWTHFDVDYEMSGKDLMDSVRESSKICRVLGGTPPVGMTYELFLAEDGSKISKSKGNGFSLDDWLKYGTKESLMAFLFQSPKSAKPIHANLIPKLEDEMLTMMSKEDLGPNDCAWFFKEDPVWPARPDIGFALLLNLAIVSQAQSAAQLIAFFNQTRSEPLEGKDLAWVQLLAHRVVTFAYDKGLYARQKRQPTDQERAAFAELATRLSMMLDNMTAEHYQYQVYEVGKKHEFQPLRSWFQALYECFLGSSDGPRFGAFIAAYGLQNSIRMLRQYEQQDA